MNEPGWPGLHPEWYPAPNAVSLTLPSQHLTQSELSQVGGISQSGLRREVGRDINLVIGWAFRRNVRREGKRREGEERRGGMEMGEESSLSVTQPS